MRKKTKQLLTLLNCAIHNTELPQLDYSHINWNYIISESKEHAIYQLLYPVIRDISPPKLISNELKEKWKHDTCVTAINLNRQLVQMSKVLIYNIN